jgi:hypothetical protein
LAQTIGSFLAAGLLRMHKNQFNFNIRRLDETKYWKNGLGFPHMNTLEYTTFSGVMLEFFGTFFLCWIILFTALHHTRPKSDVYGICVGGMVGLWIMSGGGISGAGLNPQRVIGPAVVSGEFWTYSYHNGWIYYGIPWLGGLAAGYAYYYIFVDWSLKEHQSIINNCGGEDPATCCPAQMDGVVLKHATGEKKFEIEIRHVVKAKNIRKLTEYSQMGNDLSLKKDAKLQHWIDDEMAMPEETFNLNAIKVELGIYNEEGF